MMQETNMLDGKEIENPFTPMGNMVFLKKSDIIDQTDGGIILTGKAKIDKTEGEVIATGPGRANSETGFQYPMQIKAGDGVVYGKFSGEDLTYNGAKHTILRDSDILVKFPFEEGLTMDNAEVLDDNVLVKVVEVQQEESGGILIAKTVKKTSTSSIGEVIKVGAGRFAFNGVLMEMDVSVGDMVKYRDFSAQEVEIEKENFAVLKMTDILAKF
eukprot:CAMPEP_0184863792 /NCGR_PEP_ID=MMETSP0580-20130426/12465_1 /TAXON_ID=1118495 /ORGANISM="Dactyliosolen fragilissimus" /LENGTH=213 /DNA_ID=CAMNT_0027362319 /DNA_START=163 /DNA_END=804 /DNA_ORIENTATION=-